MFFLWINIGIGGFVAVGPASWYYQGWIVGFISQILGALISLQGGWAYMRLSMKFRVYTQEDLAFSIFGKNCQLLINVIQIIGYSSFAIAIIYFSSNALEGIFY